MPPVPGELAPPPGAHLQAQFAIQPINQFLSYRPALTLEQYGQARIAKAHSHHGQISQSHFQGDMFLSAASIIEA
jgi:hypothetical protein